MIDSTGLNLVSVRPAARLACRVLVKTEISPNSDRLIVPRVKAVFVVPANKGLCCHSSDDSNLALDVVKTFLSRYGISNRICQRARHNKNTHLQGKKAKLDTTANSSTSYLNLPYFYAITYL